mgnify:CR=1 FL=1
MRKPLVIGRFWGNAEGAAGIIFAMLLVLILAAAGLGLDMARLISAKSAAQTAADGAALSAAAEPSSDNGVLSALAKDYVQANGPSSSLVALSDASVDFDASTGMITVSLAGEAPMAFMGLVGIPSASFTVTATATRASSGPLDLVLALDTTGSMNDVIKGVKKIDALRTAARELVSAVSVSEYAQIGVVKFSGLMYINRPIADETWVSDIPPDVTTKSCVWEGSGCTTTYNKKCLVDGVWRYDCPNTTCTNWEYKCSTSVKKWSGCVGVRPGLTTSIANPTNPKYPALTSGCFGSIKDLTSDRAAAMNAVSVYSTGGDTYIPGGLLWAWNLLSPDVIPYTKARSKDDMAQRSGKRAVVLMTDGVNSVYAKGDGGLAYFANDANPAARQKETDDDTRTLCKNIKNDGIILFTVAFDVTDANILSILQGCATDTGKYFKAEDAAQLKSAFGKIGAYLQNVRITK